MEEIAFAFLGLILGVAGTLLSKIGQAAPESGPSDLIEQTIAQIEGWLAKHRGSLDRFNDEQRAEYRRQEQRLKQLRRNR